MRIRALSFALVPLAVVVSPRARAQGDYPRVIQGHLSLTYAPPCSVCHEKGNTGTGTVVTPFGWAMRGKGLVVEDPSSVGTALDALRNAHTDSDGDGASDIDELVAGTDPNSAGSVRIPNGREPGYGCGGEAPDPNRQGAGFLVPLPFAVALLRRRATRRAADRRSPRNE